MDSLNVEGVEEDEREEDPLEGFDGSALELSDEDFAKLTPEQVAKAEVVTEAKSEETTSAKEEVTATDEASLPVEAEETEKLAEEETGSEALPVSADTNKEAVEAESNSEDVKTEKQNEEVNFKQEYEKLLTPFKANGRQIQVDNVDDAITLMKMGANYNKKMAALKPNLKLIKMLEQNDLLDEQKIGNLIDISKHDSDAITKLVADAKLDPLDMDTENVKYEPKNHTVNDSQIELDQILDNIKDNESFPKTIDTISNQWDTQSKEIILNDPKIISVIDNHVQSGIFDMIVSEMDKERMLGRMRDMSDIEAYRSVGESLQAQGKFDTQPTKESQSDGIEESNSERNTKRKEAASTKGTSSTASKKFPDNFNPLSMSDDEFLKLAANDLYR